jgi:TetR/AcrR family transcriptional regulator, mexJK operon transcriptional repressor
LKSSVPVRRSHRKVAKRGRPAAGEIELRKHEILIAAKKIFAAKGFADTKVQDIARAAGVAKKTIYDHVGDKAELFRIAFATGPSEPDRQFDLPYGDGSASQVLKALARQLLAYVLSPESIALERALIIESARFPKLAREVISSAKFVFRRKLSLVIEEMVRRRLLLPTDSTRAAIYFFDVVAATDAFKAVLGYLEEPPDDEELGKRVEMFLYGYAGPKRPAKILPRRRS